ncbi:MAG: cysteine--tRNA ligase [Nitrospirae bacterium]|nr:cysteine--tRNA ligase [Nitrospirota bacterium]
MFRTIHRDYEAIFERDPAVKGYLDAALNYPGFHAILFHRMVHPLWSIGMRVLPRLVSNAVRLFTGIEIHPGAAIGPGFFIDHGMGVVIGETAEIGQECLLYQGVTLGGTGKEKGKRHPTIGSYVVIGAGAKILGPIDVGDYVKIGANSVVLHSVPDNSIVVGVPGRVVKRKLLHLTEDGPVEALDHTRFPDPVERKFEELRAHVSMLERKIERMAGKKGMKVYNSMSGEKEDFVPLTMGHVSIYVCGVTVYDLCHVGHARSSVVFDVIRSYLTYKGYGVKFVKNFTDVDDKIINRSKEEGVAWDLVAKKYIDEYYVDMDRLGVARADVEPLATEHVEDMIELISGLMSGGYAYVMDGDVYFSVDSFDGYGKLSGRSLISQEAGSRVTVDERKNNPLDFALWKRSKEGEPFWESPWGPGRPGWHIECSAMSRKYLGDTFDIHGGGADLIFPHHENELAQSEAFTKKPFVKYWVHNGFITLDKEKMSKSLGNFFTIRDILGNFDPEVLRLFLISTHYRNPIDFSYQQLADTEVSIDRHYSTVLRVDTFLKSHGSKPKKDSEYEAFSVSVSSFREKFIESMDDDFNTAQAVGHIFDLVRSVNRYLDAKPSGDVAHALLTEAMKLLDEVCQVLNVFRKNPKDWYRSLMKTRKLPITEREIDSSIERRNAARKAKDWIKADEIRNSLLSCGIILEDRPGCTGWRVKV